MKEAVPEARGEPTRAPADRTASRQVEVWDLPLRLWHWVLAVCVLVAWFTPEGKEMTQRDWDRAQASALTVFLNGNAISEPGPRGERITDDSFLLMFNASPRALDFVVPVDHGRQWQVVVDTARSDGVPPHTGPKVQAGSPRR